MEMDGCIKTRKVAMKIAYQYFIRIKVLKKVLSNVPQKHSSSTKMNQQNIESEDVKGELTILLME
jgi:hypothetical protein